jgi:hypothetical protein
MITEFQYPTRSIGHCGTFLFTDIEGLERAAVRA